MLRCGITKQLKIMQSMFLRRKDTWSHFLLQTMTHTVKHFKSSRLRTTEEEGKGTNFQVSSKFHFCNPVFTWVINILEPKSPCAAIIDYVSDFENGLCFKKSLSPQQKRSDSTHWPVLRGNWSFRTKKPSDITA